jgi:hypothetical protein
LAAPIKQKFCAQQTAFGRCVSRGVLEATKTEVVCFSPVDNDLERTLKALREEMRAAVPTGQVPVCRVLIEGKSRRLARPFATRSTALSGRRIETRFNTRGQGRSKRRSSTGCGDCGFEFGDDGVWIDAQVASQGHRQGHWGLPGLRERATP